MEDRVSIRFSVEDGIIEVEQKKGASDLPEGNFAGPASKLLPEKRLYQEDAPPVLSSGFLPLNTLAVRQTKESVSRGRMVPPSPCGSVAV